MSVESEWGVFMVKRYFLRASVSSRTRTLKLIAFSLILSIPSRHTSRLLDLHSPWNRRYPKLHRLQALKRSLTTSHAHPPLYLTLDPVSESPLSLPSLLSPSSLSSMSPTVNQTQFDVIHIRPPPTYTDPEISAIPVRALSADPSFVFLWVGSSDTHGLERGREMLLRWGFRRCEEVVWVRTKRGGMGGGDGGKKKRGRASFHRRTGNTLPKDDNDDESEQHDQENEETEEDSIPTNLLVTQKEHCLVGIRGTVRRKTDGWFVHCNVGE